MLMLERRSGENVVACLNAKIFIFYMVMHLPVPKKVFLSWSLSKAETPGGRAGGVSF